MPQDQQRSKECHIAELEQQEMNQRQARNRPGSAYVSTDPMTPPKTQEVMTGAQAVAAMTGAGRDPNQKRIEQLQANIEAIKAAQDVLTGAIQDSIEVMQQLLTERSQ